MGAATPTASPPASAADLDTCTARDLLMPRLTPPSFTEPTPTPMELTPTPTDTELLPELLAIPVPPPASLPGPPRVSARGVLTPTPLFFTELTESPPMSPETPTAMAPADTESLRDTLEPLSLTSSSPDSTKKQFSIIY